MKKITGWKTRGMNRDISVSAFNNEFSFENVNLRIMTNEGNTALSWVNEKGTAQISLVNSNGTAITISGTPIGTAVLNRTLVLFTTTNTGESQPATKTDRIYKLFYRDAAKTIMEVALLFNGNLNFSALHPLETMVSYEAEHIQKVYWVDGRNQPRIINIANGTKLAQWNSAATKSIATFFDFVPSAAIKESVTVTRAHVGGEMFAPGVIQYCFTYVNKYGQQTNIIWTSALYYLTHSDRGASPEEEVVNSFIINITGVDTTFDYLRLYSIQRTSVDATPTVKMLDDIPVSSTITYTDNGTTGYAMDPTELLYVGGKEIIANTLADKDNTLFIGNFSQKNASMAALQKYFNDIRDTQDEMTISFRNSGLDSKIVDYGILHSGSNDMYIKSNTLVKGSRRNITTFKGGEYYRFGFQLQKNTGEWSDPIFMNDKQNTLYPDMFVSSSEVAGQRILNASLVYAQATINLTSIASKVADLYTSYKKIRPVVVYPTVGERAVLCQGVVNPTVFNIADRIDNSPFAQSSWYFRPYMVNSTDDKNDDQKSPATDIVDGSNYSDVTAFNTASNTFLSKDNITTYNILICNIPESRRKEIFNRRYISYKNFSYYEKHYTSGGIVPFMYMTWGYSQPSKSEDQYINKYKGNYENVPYDGKWNFEMALFIGNMTGQPYGGAKCILFGKSPFPVPLKSVVVTEEGEGQDEGGTFTMEVRRVIEYSSEVNFWPWPAESNTNYKFSVYNKLVNDNGMLYYSNPTQDTAYDNYSFRLYYEFESRNAIVGKCIQISLEGAASGISIINNNKTGNAVTFTHYESLPTQDGITPENGGVNVGGIFNQRSNIEIQGSLCRYPTMYGSKIENSNLATNSQFVVDQSIITMHSPDIEFDSEVQNYDTEHLKMRIVGIVPITSNASAHRITTSSSSLETYYNDDTQAVKRFGTGETSNNIVHKNIDLYAGQRLVSDYLWNDSYYLTDTSKEDKATTAKYTYNFLVFPWQRNGSLNNDPRQDDFASSMLKTKKESNILYSLYSKFFAYPSTTEAQNNQLFENISTQMHLTENDFVINMRLPRQKNSTSEINYYPNIDKVLYNINGYDAYVKEIDKLPTLPQGGSISVPKLTSPVHMRYKSTSHAVIALNGSEYIPVLPRGVDGDGNAVGYYPDSSDSSASYSTIWGDMGVKFTQKLLNESSLFLDDTALNFLWLAELYKDVENRFGGTTEYALKNNKWEPAGEAVSLTNGNNNLSSVNLQWTDGDTFFQRYDHLKTYAFSEDDTNQLVEILSFMCESRVNIDGRYDRNKGQMDNTLIRPGIFNLLNPVYSQRDNFFTQRAVNTDSVATYTYPNQVTYSKTKTSGADVDLYTNVTLGSVLELDGDKGKLNKLIKFNDQLVAFQDTGISQILYNENVQIASTAGVPIEIANSGKVQGKRYIIDTVGCTNKWSIVSSPAGIYFMDSHDRSMYLFNGQLQNISVQGGMNTWSKNNIPGPEVTWDAYTSNTNFRGFYDKINQEVLFANSSTALAWSEKSNAFTSFYSYENIPFFNNLDDTGVWVRRDGTPDNPSCTLWKHNAGAYCNFFGVQKPFSMTLVGNPEPQTDKIFTNLEIAANITGEGTVSNSKLTPFLPFSHLEAWNEYQHGTATLSHLTGSSAMKHFMAGANSLKRKFRLWRCDIPRDNAAIGSVASPFSTDTALGIKRFAPHAVDRLRNPWLYLKLYQGTSGSNKKTEIHDILMTYFS